MITSEYFIQNEYRELFLDNEFLKEYLLIIQNAKNQIRFKTPPLSENHIYYESHHIVPVSLGGNNTKTNKVLLTAKEHFICHELLTKITIEKDKGKMYKALWRMIHGNSGQKTVPIDADLYSLIKEQNSISVSLQFKGKKLSPEICKKRSESRKGKITEEHKQIMSKTHKGKTPWNKGLKNCFSEESCKKISESKTGKTRPPITEETRQKMSESHKGRDVWNKGKSGYKRKPHSDETKQKIKDSWIERKKNKK